MNMQSIIGSLDPNILALYVAYFSVLVSSKISFVERSSDLDRIRLHSIREISRQNDGISFVKFLDILQQESKVLMFKPTKNNKTLAISNLAFGLVGAATLSQKIVPLDKDYLYLLFAATLANACIFLWYDIYFYREYKRLKDKYPIPNNFKSDDIHKIMVLND